jgi:hypothetical protein
VDDQDSPDREGTPRRSREPLRFVSLVEQLHRQAQQRRPQADDHAPHEAPLVAVTRRLVRATWLLVVVGFLSVGAAILQWVALRSADDKVASIITSYQSIANSASAILVATQRPWLAVDIAIDSELSINDKEAVLTVHSTIRNTGHTPAMDVEIYPHLGNFFISREEQKTFCDNWRNIRKASPHTRGGVTIFPDEWSISTGYVVGVGKSSFTSSHRNGKPFHMLMPHVYGCVIYNFAFDDTIHTTGFNYTICHKKADDGTASCNPVFDIENGSVPKEELVKSIDSTGNAGAD